MKKILLFLCTILCANVLMAQTEFMVGELIYKVTSTNPAEVEVYFYGNSPTTVNIPETVSYEGTTYSVTAIDELAFSNCSSLTSVTIPNSVTSIENYAFYGCQSLTSVTLPNNATIDEFAFAYAGPFSQNNITIDRIIYRTKGTNGIIGNYTFNNVGDITFYLNGNTYNLIFINNVEVYQYGGYNPTIVNIPETVSYNGTTYSVTSIGASAFRNCRSLTSVTIPNSVTYIEGPAFYGCSSLTSVTLSNNITSLSPFSDYLYDDYGLFEGCSSLTSIDIPNSVTSIGEKTFRNCSSLTSITIPNSVTSIGGAAFYGCSSLTSVTLSNNITSLPAYYESNVYYGFFEGCSSLTSITIPNSVTSIEEETFKNCSSLTSITISNSVTSIGDGAFSGCSSLSSITIPNSVTSIGNRAFFGCTALQNITLGENVTSIASGAFSSSFFLQNVTCLATTPPTLADNTVFPYPNIATLTVPCGTLEAYSSPTSFWNMFFMGRISEDGYEVVANVNNDAFGSVAIENNCSTATLTANANACYQFVGWNDGNTENPRLVTLSSDTTLTANFEVMVMNNDITATICEGQVYNENGFNVSEAGTYTQTLQTINGCDSIVTLTLNVNPMFNTPLTATICEGSVYNENGFNVSEAGVYSRTLQAVNGCDSIVTLTLNVNPAYLMELTTTICDNYTLNISGFEVNEAGVYTQTLQTVNGCDSIITLTVTANPSYNTNLEATICEGQVYTENGFNVSEAGTYTQTLQTINGCDSIVTLTLNVNPIFNTPLTATICEGQTYTENGFNVSEAGTYTQSLQTINGCDSIVTLTLNVNPTFNTELVATICEGTVYNENGFNVSEAGVYTQSLQTINGCDSVVTLTLNVTPILNTELTATICEGTVYNENGFNVSEAGVYTQSLQTVNGCDSIVTLTLNVTPSYHTNLTATICEGSELNISGFNVSEAGTYTQTHTAVNGCDSIVTLTVTALPVYNTNLTLTICEGTSLNLCGFNVTEGGVYTQSYIAVNGCDSIVTLTVTELPTVHTDLTLTICEGTSLNFSGFNVSEAGVYTQTLTSVNGCDSVVTLTVSVNPTFDTTINATINAGETYAEFGFNESEAGTYVQNLQTVNGCDSTITLILDVNSSLMDVEHSELSFYPNPTDSKITFSSTIESIEVIDLTGRCVLTFSNAREINIESLPAGAYYLRLHQKDKAIMRKVIKE